MSSIRLNRYVVIFKTIIWPRVLVFVLTSVLRNLSLTSKKLVFVPVNMFKI